MHPQFLPLVNETQEQLTEAARGAALFLEERRLADVEVQGAVIQQGVINLPSEIMEAESRARRAVTQQFVNNLNQLLVDNEPYVRYLCFKG